MSSGLSSLYSKANKLNIGKLETSLVDLSKLSNLVKNEVVKKTEYNAKIKDTKGEIPSITNLATNAALNAKINEVKDKIPNIANSVTTTAPTAVENKI